MIHVVSSCVVPGQWQNRPQESAGFSFVKAPRECRGARIGRTFNAARYNEAGPQ